MDEFYTMTPVSDDDFVLRKSTRTWISWALSLFLGACTATAVFLIQEINRQDSKILQLQSDLFTERRQTFASIFGTFPEAANPDDVEAVIEAMKNQQMVFVIALNELDKDQRVGEKQARSIITFYNSLFTTSWNSEMAARAEAQKWHIPLPKEQKAKALALQKNNVGFDSGVALTSSNFVQGSKPRRVRHRNSDLQLHR